ncbi:PREDICTED: WRKY transcription factor 55-like isoform X2 [Ipomoea nil]|uniref:WRKY transcription factor 55-like isoform X2 n=1 Tax=Ipomoea nil TaxID=35883 RepID=UPI000900B32B|nr:PREDICTED: WRKY transcription factor 55-like isoform X2 [Ipomoea nil]
MMSRPNDHLKISKKQQEMDENMITTALMMTILRGIQQAKDLEPNLAHNLASRRDYIARACDDIVRVFSSVRERVSSSSPPQVIAPPPLQLGGVLDHTWLSTTAAHDPHLFQPHMVAPLPLPAQPVAAAAARVHRSGSCGGVPAAQRPRRLRRDEIDRHTKIVEAPQMGNVDIPPEDGYTWRKYGQKEILGSRFPRAYYRCTHQKLYSCPAKKQVQRLDDNPFMFQVTYRSNHICHMSATAPSSAPPPLQPPPTTSSGGAVTGSWLTMDIKPQPPGEAAGTSSGGPFGGGHAVSVSSTSNVPVAAGSGTAGPSTARYDRDVVGGSGGGDYGGQPVVDLVDVMFNYSGSSSNNSMDLIFPSTDQKGDISGEKN